MPWFKNSLVYQLNKAIDWQLDQLTTQLNALAFTPCGRHDTSRLGWIAPFPFASDQQNPLVYQDQHYLLLCLQKEEKILPAAVIKQRLQQEIQQQEEKQQRKLSKKEQTALKDSLIQLLLPQAFSRFSRYSLVIDSQKQRILINSSSSKQAETCLALLRKTLGSLPVVPYFSQQPIENTLTLWLAQQQIPAPFQLLDEAELRAPQTDGAILRCKHQALLSEEIQLHLQAGKLISQLALGWHERISFVLTADGCIKRLKFHEQLREQNNDIDKADKAQLFAADFLLMSQSLQQLIDDLTLQFVATSS